MSIGHAPRYDFTNQTVGALCSRLRGDNKTRVRADRACLEVVILRNYKQGSRTKTPFKFTTAKGDFSRVRETEAELSSLNAYI